VRDDAGQVLLDQDENIRESSTAEKLATLKPVYEDGAG
jgi:acetyl-CoA acetyltransferase